MVGAVIAKDDDVVTWERVKRAAAVDDTCRLLNEVIENGFPPPRKEDVAESLKPFHKLKDDLYTLEGVPCIGERHYVPKSLRKEILSTLHIFV